MELQRRLQDTPKNRGAWAGKMDVVNESKAEEARRAPEEIK
jgi:hypothetical protein